MNFAKKHQAIQQAKEQTFQVFNEHPGFDALSVQLTEALAEKENDTALRIVFAGQYSSGKSSIIAALTNDSSIKIDSDIATDTTEDFQWRSVILTDTPGISAGRTDHDAITHRKIQHADVLVYVVTYSLFDNLLIEDFKRLAVDHNYKHKMMLVVNKLYSEEGDYDDLCQVYRDNLEHQIGAETLNAMPVSFVSSANALDPDPEYHPYGHMNDLTAKLDTLIAKNQSMAGAEAVGQIIAAQIEDELSGRSEGANQDEQALLRRVERVVSQVKREAQTVLKQEVNDIKALARVLGSERANEVGTNENLQQDIEDSSDKLNQAGEEAFKRLEERFNELDANMADELAQLNDTNLAERFFGSFEAKHSADKQSGEQVRLGSIAEEMDFEIAEKLSSMIGRQSQVMARAASGTKAGSGMLNASGASGSSVHQGVLKIGKALGYKFKPWQAANIAKNFGNVAKVLGPVMVALPAIFEVVSVVQEEKRSKDLASASRSIREGFQDAGSAIATELQTSGTEFISSKYGQLLDEISNLRLARINEASNLDAGAAKLQQIAKGLRVVLG